MVDKDWLGFECRPPIRLEIKDEKTNEKDAVMMMAAMKLGAQLYDTFNCYLDFFGDHLVSGADLIRRCGLI